MKKILITLVAVLGLPALLWAAESGVVTTTRDAGSKIKRMVLAWTADASGDKANVTISGVAGRVIRFITDPGTTAPADNYDITLLDADGFDIAGGTLANRDTANTEQVWATTDDGTTDAHFGVPVVGNLTATFTNQANANCDGELILYVIED